MVGVGGKLEVPSPFANKPTGIGDRLEKLEFINTGNKYSLTVSVDINQMLFVVAQVIVVAYTILYKVLVILQILRSELNRTRSPNSRARDLQRGAVCWVHTCRGVGIF